MQFGGVSKGEGITLRVAAAIGLLSCCLILQTPAPAQASVATARPDDPVVLKGSDVSRLNGICLLYTSRCV